MRRSIKNPVIFFLGGAAVTFAGGITGLIAGMTYGGNYAPLFEYGGLPGYEGAGLLGSMLGAAIISFIWIVAVLGDKALSRGLLIASIATVIALLLQDFLARWNSGGNFFIAFLPLASQLLLFIWHKPEEF